MGLNDYFDALDLRNAFWFAILFGVLASVWVMQMYGTGLIGGKVRYSVIDTLRRWSIAGIAMTFLWSLSYSVDKNWEPWPPNMAMIIILDLFLVFTAISGYQRAHTAQENSRPTAT